MWLLLGNHQPHEPPRFVPSHGRRAIAVGMSRHNDHSGLEFTRIEECEDVHFAHARGFIAKISATDKERLKELVAAAWV